MTKTRADYALPFQTPPPRQLPCMTGRLKHFQANWRKITNDPWILQTISGYRIPFMANSAKNNSGKDIASAEITARCDNRTNQQTSYKDGNRPSDRSVHFNPICSSTDQQNTPSVQPATAEQFCGNTQVQNGGLSFATLNPAGKRLYDEVGLEGRLFSMPIAVEHRRYLRFIFNDLLYEFQCLPFGLSTAPRTFTKVLKPVIALLRQRGLRVIIYLDDLLLLHSNLKELEKLFLEVCQLLTDLGFLIKKEKCSTAPVQSLVFLGALINSLTMTLAVPLTKSYSAKHKP